LGEGLKIKREEVGRRVKTRWSSGLLVFWSTGHLVKLRFNEKLPLMEEVGRRVKD
jgi:hypothetical protein